MRSPLPIVVLGAMLLSGCDPASALEPSLDEVVGVHFDLPISETEFLDLMNAHTITVERRGPGSPMFQAVPASRREANLQELNVEHAYLVYAGFDAQLRRSKQYMAYVDRGGKVVFIERAFAYIAP